jgi:hypothetical protein
MDKVWAYETNVKWLGFGEIQSASLTFNNPPPFGVTWYLGTGTPSATQIDMWSIAAHEWGHAVALNHVAGTANVMYCCINGGQTRRYLSAGTRRIDGVVEMRVGALLKATTVLVLVSGAGIAVTGMTHRDPARIVQVQSVGPRLSFAGLIAESEAVAVLALRDTLGDHWNTVDGRAWESSDAEHVP